MLEYLWHILTKPHLERTYADDFVLGGLFVVFVVLLVLTHFFVSEWRAKKGKVK